MTSLPTGSQRRTWSPSLLGQALNLSVPFGVHFPGQGQREVLRVVGFFLTVPDTNRPSGNIRHCYYPIPGRGKKPGSGSGSGLPVRCEPAEGARALRTRPAQLRPSRLPTRPPGLGVEEAIDAASGLGDTTSELGSRSSL